MVKKIRVGNFVGDVIEELIAPVAEDRETAASRMKSGVEMGCMDEKGRDGFLYSSDAFVCLKSTHRPLLFV